MTEVIRSDVLHQIVQKIEKLEAEKFELNEIIKEAFNQAKYQGFDTKILKKVLQLRKKDREKLAEEEALLDVYRQALGV